MSLSLSLSLSPSHSLFLPLTLSLSLIFLSYISISGSLRCMHRVAVLLYTIYTSSIHSVFVLNMQILYGLSFFLFLSIMIFVSLEHKSSHKQHSYVYSNNQQCIVWLKIIIFILCQKSLDIKIMFHEDI